ncbi:hypothetical protein BS17DRAFT_810670 [Gyrodon lividus]|nr:hypothetical protein BS17DRAFT_810670 [Gyrodon lividus]
MQRGRKPVTTLKLLESPRTKKSCKTRSCCAATTVASLKTINQLKEYGKATYLRAKKTRKCYMGHVKRGREWLAEHFHTETDSNEQSAPDVANEQEDDSDPYRDPEFPNAFSRIPNKTSDKALTLFLTYKGYHQIGAMGQWKASALHSKTYGTMRESIKGDTYRGPWHFNEVRKQWEGNPVNSAEVKDLTTSLKHKASSEGGDRKHSLPMSKDYMDRILNWSQKACPELEGALGWLRCSLSGELLSPLNMCVKQRTVVTRHLGQIAFGTTAWTLWARKVYSHRFGDDCGELRWWYHRCFELVKLQRWNITIFDQATIDQVLNKYLAGKELLLSDRMMMFKIHLTNRKGWQRKVNKGLTEQDFRCNHYCIYPQPDLPGTDAFLWLLIWLKWLEFAHYGRTLAPDDCVFPVMGANGIIHPCEPLSHDTIQKWINEAVVGAGIPGFFSTHCFRRGGAQYHFMFAPIGQHWTLAKHNTLIRYLLDELYAYEADYSNALAPIQQELDQSLAGEAALVQPMSTEELRMVHSSVTVNMQELRADMDNIAQSVCALVEIVTGSVNNGAPPLTMPQTRLSRPLTIRIPAHGVSASAPIQTTTTSKLTMTSVPQVTAHLHTSDTNDTPTPGLHIPNIRTATSDGWRDVVKHWVSGAPELGLEMPLKDWPKKWLTGVNRHKFSMKHHNCSVIASEFLDMYKSDEARFVQAYPEAKQGITSLLKAINTARMARGDSIERPKRAQLPPRA